VQEFMKLTTGPTLKSARWVMYQLHHVQMVGATSHEASAMSETKYGPLRAPVTSLTAEARGAVAGLWVYTSGSGDLPGGTEDAWAMGFQLMSLRTRVTQLLVMERAPRARGISLDANRRHGGTRRSPRGTLKAGQRHFNQCYGDRGIRHQHVREGGLPVDDRGRDGRPW